VRWSIPFWAAGAALLLHLLGNAHYGFFRDELYFIICGRHPALGYVDQPPLVPWIAAATQVFGPSLFALRLVPGLAAAALTWMSVVLGRELGADRFAQVLTAICVTLGSDLLLQGVLLTTDVFQPLVWTVTILSVLRLARGGDDRRKGLLLGAALGVGALSKYSIAFFGFALLLGLLLTPERRVLRMPGLLLGLGLAALLGLPSVVWQLVHGFPFLELLRNGSHGKNVVLGPAAFAVAQLKMLNPFYAPVWLLGLWRVWRRAELRWMGITYLALYLVFFVLHGKDYYLAAIYPALFAAGAVQFSEVLRGAAARWLTTTAAVAAGLLLLPLTLPVLPVEAFIAYQDALHITPTAAENQKLDRLPQHWADMFGWPELAATMANVYASLSPEERARAYILVDNYGEASAINFFGPALGLPPAISGHNAYFTWGPGPRPDLDLMIDMNATVEDDRKFCRDARLGGIHRHPYAMPYEQVLSIVVCRGSYRPLSEVFPRQKHFI
jgi:Dolichyl-phosphate-mannose-protein mannosyltransferase